MNRICLLLLYVTLVFPATAQTYVTQTVMQTVIPERNIYLNGGTRAAFGGKSRIVIAVRLPKGTKSWYYSYSTSPGESGTQNLQLLAQLTSLAADPSGIAGSVIEQINLPAGSHSIDAYLLDQRNAVLFMEKADLNGGQYSYYPEGTVMNTRQAIVPIRRTTGSDLIYIGLKNPSELEGVNITLEVVAEISTQVYEDVWTVESSDFIYNNCLQTFGARTTAAEQICICYKNKLTTGYTPTAYKSLSIAEQSDFFQQSMKECAGETGNNASLENNERVKQLEELIRGEVITKDYQEQEKNLLELITLGVTDWQVYNTLGFCQLSQKKYELAKGSLTIGLGKNPTNLFLLGNLGDYYLLTGQYDRAIAIFRLHKNEKIDDKRKFKESVASDLKEFELLGISNADFVRVRKELGID